MRVTKRKWSEKDVLEEKEIKVKAVTDNKGTWLNHVDGHRFYMLMNNKCGGVSRMTLPGTVV